MTEKEEGEDIEDALMKNLYNGKEIESFTGVKDYKSYEYLSTKNYYKENFNKAVYKSLSLHKKRIYSMDWLDNNSGLILVSGSSDNSIKIWDFNEIFKNSNKQNTINPLFTINSHSDTVNNIASRKNYENQFISSSLDKHIKFWDIRTNIINHSNKLNLIKSPFDKLIKEEIKHLKFNNSGEQFAFMNKSGTILYLYDFGKFEEIKQINFNPPIYDFVFDNNDTKIFSACEDGNIYINNIASNSNKMSISGSLFPLYSLDIDKKNKYLISGGNDGIIINYDIDELMSCKTYKRDDQGIKQVMYNYDDKFIATIYDEKNIDFFSTELDDHIFTYFTRTKQHFIKWNNKRNILGFVSDEKRGDDWKNKKNEELKIGSEGDVHFFILPNL